MDTKNIHIYSYLVECSLCLIAMDTAYTVLHGKHPCFVISVSIASSVELVVVAQVSIYSHSKQVFFLNMSIWIVTRWKELRVLFEYLISAVWNAGTYLILKCNFSLCIRILLILKLNVLSINLKGLNVSTKYRTELAT